jgi:hypothetical protein
LVARLHCRTHKLVRFHAASEPDFLHHFVHGMNKMNMEFWQTLLDGYGQNAIQFEKRQRIL